MRINSRNKKIKEKINNSSSTGELQFAPTSPTASTGELQFAPTTAPSKGELQFAPTSPIASTGELQFAPTTAPTSPTEKILQLDFKIYGRIAIRPNLPNGKDSSIRFQNLRANCNSPQHIIKDKKAYDNISNYIMNNPIKWDEDKF